MSTTDPSPPLSDCTPEAGALAAELAAVAVRVAELAAQVGQVVAKTDDHADDLTDNMRLLTASEVMERTKLSRGAVYRLARQGELGAVRVGERGYRFNERELKAWLAAGGSSR